MEGEGKFERVSGTSIGGGTFWGLGKLLTKCKRWGLFFPGTNALLNIDLYSIRLPLVYFLIQF